MKWFQISVRSMSFLVLLVALDCTWAPNIWGMRSSFGFGGSGWHIMDLPVLGMANFLAISGLILGSKRKYRVFVFGLFGAGILLISVYASLLLGNDTARHYLKRYMLFFQSHYLAWFPLYDFRINKELGYIWRYVPLDLLLMIVGTLPMLFVAAIFGILLQALATPLAPAGARGGGNRLPESHRDRG